MTPIWTTTHFSGSLFEITFMILLTSTIYFDDFVNNNDYKNKNRLAKNNFYIPLLCSVRET